MRIISTILALLGAFTIHAQDLPTPTDTPHVEADLFLSKMPEHLQERQTEAIRKAMAGEHGMLSAVRNARNAAPTLPDGVSRTDVGKGLCLYTSSRYDNDTVPLLIYYHGGGWVIGSVNSCARYCSAMAERGIAVLAVDYRLAPEHPFPQGLTDCIDAVRFAQAHMAEWKCSSISVGGDSSGGNLAIATALSFPPKTFAALIAFYPVTAAYADGSSSWQQFGKGFGLDSALMNAFNAAYLADVHDPLVSPIEASDSLLSTLPPTLIVAAERDILRCQGHDFASRLSCVGVEVQYVLISGSVHLFITVDGQPTAFRHAVDESLGFINAHQRGERRF